MEGSNVDRIEIDIPAHKRDEIIIDMPGHEEDEITPDVSATSKFHQEENNSREKHDTPNHTTPPLEDGAIISPQRQELLQIVKKMAEKPADYYRKCGLEETQLDLIRWHNPRLQKHYKPFLFKEELARNVHNYEVGVHFVSDKNQKEKGEMLHCTLLIVFLQDGVRKVCYFDSNGDVPDKLFYEVEEWNQLKLQQPGNNTCALYCLMVFDKLTSYLLEGPDSNLSTFSMRNLFLPEAKIPVDFDQYVIDYLKNNILPAVII